MKLIILFLVTYGQSGFASIPQEKLLTALSKFIDPLSTRSGWQDFLKQKKDILGTVTPKSPGPIVDMLDLNLEADGTKYEGGMVINSVYIDAKPETVVSAVNNPKLFKSMFDLDKQASLGESNPDDYRAQIFKKIPGIFTQDYTLHYKAHREKGFWIQRIKQESDKQGLALRDISKTVEPYGPGSVFREVSVFIPLKWWMRTSVLKSTLRKITRNEIHSMDRVIKCVAEKSKAPDQITEALAEACRKL